MVKKSCFTLIIAAFVSLLVLAESAPADLVNGVENGDFSTDISIVDNGWDIPAILVDWSVDDLAVFFMPDTDEQIVNSTLSQEITVDPDFPILSFDVLMETDLPPLPETDTFTASLNGVTFYTLPSDDDRIDEWGVFAETVTWDVSSSIGPIGSDPVEVELVFNLKHDYFDGLDDDGITEIDAVTTVRLDNVALVPVPGALVLGSIGLSLAGCWLSKRRTL